MTNETAKTRFPVFNLSTLEILFDKTILRSECSAPYIEKLLYFVDLKTENQINARLVKLEAGVNPIKVRYT